MALRGVASGCGALALLGALSTSCGGRVATEGSTTTGRDGASPSNSDVVEGGTVTNAKPANGSATPAESSSDGSASNVSTGRGDPAVGEGNVMTIGGIPRSTGPVEPPPDVAPSIFPEDSPELDGISCVPERCTSAQRALACIHIEEPACADTPYALTINGLSLVTDECPSVESSYFECVSGDTYRLETCSFDSSVPPMSCLRIAFDVDATTGEGSYFDEGGLRYALHIEALEQLEPLDDIAAGAASSLLSGRITGEMTAADGSVSDVDIRFTSCLTEIVGCLK